MQRLPADVKREIMRDAHKPKGQPGKLPSTVGDVEVQAGTQDGTIVLSCQAKGESFTLWGNVPANWAAAGATITIFAKAGRVRAPAGPGAGPFVVPAVAGSYQLANLVFQLGGADSIEVEIAGAPPILPAVPAPALVLSGASWYLRNHA